MIDTMPVRTVSFPSHTNGMSTAVTGPSSCVSSDRKTNGPKALFVDAAVHPLTQAILEEAATSFSTLYSSNKDTIGRFVSQLLPVTVDKIATWGDDVLKISGETSSKGATLTKRLSDLGIDGALTNILERVNKNESLVDKLLNRSKLDVKPQLVGFRSELMSLMPECDVVHARSSKNGLMTTLKLISLASLLNVIERSMDSSTATAAANRRIILQQAATQMEMTSVQMEQLKTIITDQLARIDQLLHVTIPAIESAKAVKGVS